MNDLRIAIEIVSNAEVQLRDLIQKAFAEHRYKDMTDVASLADGLRSLLNVAVPHKDEEQATEHKTLSPKPVSANQRSKVKRADTAGYPRFERDGDKLVKVGWSRKEKRAYEHRAPREVIFRVGEVLSGKTVPGTVFTMEQLLPVKDTSGHEIPSYQVYLAIAWLRAAGAVDQRGKDGYTRSNGVLEPTSLQELWDLLPKHR